MRSRPKVSVIPTDSKKSSIPYDRAFSPWMARIVMALPVVNCRRSFPTRDRAGQQAHPQGVAGRAASRRAARGTRGLLQRLLELVLRDVHQLALRLAPGEALHLVHGAVPGDRDVLIRAQQLLIVLLTGALD